MAEKTNKFSDLVRSSSDGNVYDQKIEQSLKWYKQCTEKSKATKKSKKNTPKVPKKETKPKDDAAKRKQEEDEMRKNVESPKVPVPGWMMQFSYDPKWADSLKYYDIYPLILVLQAGSTHFMGLNFHYLSPVDRASFFDLLHKYVGFNEEANTVTINISTSILKDTSRLSYYKPCIKKYLYSHVKSPFNAILPIEWEYALFLPTEKFVKATAEQVWAESKIIAGK